MDELLSRSCTNRDLHSQKITCPPDGDVREYLWSNSNPSDSSEASSNFYPPPPHLQITLPTYENLQPPPKPSFNRFSRIQLPAPPKPSLISPQTEQLDTLIYCTLKEIRPESKTNLEPPTSPKLVPQTSPNRDTSSPIENPRRFTVTPVSSPRDSTPNSYLSDDPDDEKPEELEEPLEFITVPEDLANLDRKSILKARFRKGVQYAKRILGFLISHIGLSLMVVGYTILGSLVFCAVERDKEQQVKQRMVDHLNSTLKELMDLWLSSYFNLKTHLDLLEAAGLENRTYTLPPKQGLEGLEWYLRGLELSNGIIPKHWIESMLPENSSTTLQSILNSTGQVTFAPATANLTEMFNFTQASSKAHTSPTPDFAQQWTTLSPSLELGYSRLIGSMLNQTGDNVTNADLANLTVLAGNVKDSVSRIIGAYVNKVIHAVKDEGWNGASNADDINWTFEGGLLFAITVITTIGRIFDTFELF